MVTVDVVPLALEFAAPRNAIAVVGTETVTDRVVVAVPPRLSVTVSVIVYVPAAAYVCDAVAPEPVVPSPKFQAYEAMLPSESVDALASAVQLSPPQLAVKAAVGGTLPATVDRNTALPRQSLPSTAGPLTVVEVVPGTPLTQLIRRSVPVLREVR
jgi:hypothetical protein